MSDRTALLIFAKYPHPGTVKTRLANRIGDETAMRLYRAFTEITLQRFRKISHTDCIVYFTPPQDETLFRSWLGDRLLYLPQCEGALGERFINAFDSLLPEYKSVIALGSDSPDLPFNYVQRSIESFKENEAVIGPSSDGGYYLIGLKHPLPELFKEIPWSTAEVYERTLAKAMVLGLSMKMLPPWYDIDTLVDLHRLVRSETPGFQAIFKPYRRLLKHLDGLD